jgi:hypothetical protein
MNINKGCNPDLEHKSEILSGYTAFIAKVRDYEKEHNLEDAVRLSVKYCMANGILEDYFKQNSSEVVSMMFTEYNVEDAIEWTLPH